ncbi:SGNH/GDSL hydrolase family protein [Sphingomonas koreensis]
MFALLAAGLLLGTAEPSSPLPVHAGGRTVTAADGSRSFGWPGVYFEARFRGTAVRVRFDAPADHLRLSIDGKEHRVFRAPGTVDVTIDGLPHGEHVVRLEKLTESQSGSSRFIAFEAPGGTALPPQPRKRQIEFIGDSFTVGYGNTSPGVTCTPQQVHALTDTSQAFGPLVASAVGADYRIHAYSGYGMVRNYDGNVRGQSLPLLYPRAIPGDAEPVAAAEPAWQPGMIAIGLGGNDFSTPIKPGEAWRDADALRTAYRDRYVAFVTELAARNPQARFLLMASDLFHADVAAVAARLQPSLGARVRTLRITGFELTGCQSHPSLADHRRAAKLIGEALADQ